MKIAYISALFCLSFIPNSVAQVLPQDAQGKSSILYRGNAINFDLTQGRASFAINSYSNEYEPNKKYASFWGLQGAANSKNGLAGIVNAGSLVPEGSFNLTGGLTFTEGENPGYTTARTELDILYGDRARQNRKIADALDDIKEAAKTSGQISTDGTLQAKIENEFNTKGTFELADAIGALATAEKDVLKKAELIVLEKAVRNVTAPFQEQRTLSSKQVDKFRDQLDRSYWRGRHLFYGLIGGSASSFSYLKDSTVTNNLSNRFEKKAFETLRFGIGYNYQRAGNMVVGASLVGEQADNFKDLKSTEYTLTTTTQTTSTTAITSPATSTVVTQRLDDKQTFTGYAGNYQTYIQTALNVDLVKFYKGARTDQGVVAINYYARLLFSNKPAIIPATLNLGTGAYFFQNNGTFIGGVYLEFRDVTNQVASFKSDPVLKPFYSRVSFGIVTKFSISSIISYGL